MKKEEAQSTETAGAYDYKRLHNYPLVKVRNIADLYTFKMIVVIPLCLVLRHE